MKFADMAPIAGKFWPQTDYSASYTVSTIDITYKARKLVVKPVVKRQLL